MGKLERIRSWWELTEVSVREQVREVRDSARVGGPQYSSRSSCESADPPPVKWWWLGWPKSILEKENFVQKEWSKLALDLFLGFTLKSPRR